MLVSANKKVFLRNQIFLSLFESKKLTGTILLSPLLSYQSYRCRNKYSDIKRHCTIDKYYAIDFTSWLNNSDIFFPFGISL